MVTGTYGRDKVIHIINSVLQKVEKAEEFSRESLFRELGELRQIIHQLRSDISSVRPNDISQKHIATATDELDAVVEATEVATGEIMESCEKISEIAAEAGGDVSSRITDEVTKIFEACTFQDITGQRITKVVSTLKLIEAKVAELIHVLDEGHEPVAVESSAAPVDDDERVGDARLLNGPQLPGAAISQDDIDKLLSEFD